MDEPVLSTRLMLLEYFDVHVNETTITLHLIFTCLFKEKKEF
jgi:hypothetical protein